MAYWVRATWRAFAALVLALPGVAMAESTDILVIYSQNRLLPATVEVDGGLNPPSDVWLPGRKLQFFAEYLDHPNFTGVAYETRTAQYLREKYASRPPRLIVAGGYVALKFLLRYRDQMFPGVHLVHVAVDRDFLESTPDLPQDLTGVPVDYDVAGTFDLALRLQPHARRLVVVTGVTSWADDRLADVRQVLERRKPSIPVEYWSGLRTTELLTRLKALDADTIVYTPGYFRDSAGQAFTPLESVRLMAVNSGAPVYTVYSSHIGSGVLGGRMSSFTDMGREARMLIDSVLDGKQPDRGVAHAPPTAAVQLDWRAVRRWNIPVDRIPPDAVIHFRTPTFWELYRVPVIASGLVVLAQAGLIAALLLERRRRQRTASALSESERRMRMAAKAARLSMFMWDPLRQRARPGAQAQERGEPATDPVADFDAVMEAVHPGDRSRVQAAAQRVIEEGGELDIEFRMVGRDGGVHWMAARGDNAPDGRITGVSMDITERKHADLQAAQDRTAMMHLSRVSTIGQLSAAIAHQLNQPLTAIRFNAESARKMLEGSSIEPEELKEVLDDIVTEDARAADIIRNLSALYRRGPMIDRAVVQLNDLVLETLELLRTEFIGRQVTVRLHLADDLPPVDCSRIQIQQVLLNLVLNGIDAMAATAVGDRVLSIRSVFDGQQVQLWVVDRGTGIPPESVGRLFDPFWTTKSQGLGVGLAISEAIVQAHHGKITVGSNPEGGAAFCVVLPVSHNSQGQER